MVSLGARLCRFPSGWSTVTHALVLALVATAIGACFLQEPVLGDDLTYWALAFDVHEQGFSAIREAGFHDLRWPVWAMCWLLQFIAPRGLVSYWGVPIMYLAAGATLTFALAKRLSASLGTAWACGLAFVFHPFLDAVAYSPMPDLSEGVWGAAAVLSWWKLMHAAGPQRACLYAVATGLFVFILEANRITGVFIVPVLVLCTAAFFRPRFRWLVAAGVVALGCYAAECLFYHQLFGDWLHDLTANANNKGAEGTDFPNAWMLPFRFLDSFWHDRLARYYSLSALAGIWFAFRRGDVFSRVVVVWFGVLFLEYSCAPQSLSPIRPLVRDGTRFLACLAVPTSLLAVVGLRELLARFAQIARTSEAFPSLGTQPFTAVTAGLLGVAFLVGATNRPFFDPGFIPGFRRYLACVPDGTSVFSHVSMRGIVNLVDTRGAERLRWVTHSEIFGHDRVLEKEAAQCGEFWYERTLVSLGARRDLHRTKSGPHPMLASYFAAPQQDWTLACSLMKARSPELVFYRRRTNAAPPQLYGADAVEWRDVFPGLPTVWERGHSPARPKVIWKIPEHFKGKLVRLQFDSAAEQNDAFAVRLRFISGTRKQAEPFVLRPILYPGGGIDFFTLEIPAASTACEIQLRFAERTQRVSFRSFSAIVENAPAP